MKTFSIKTLGCKLNQYESARITAMLKENGFTAVSFGEKADTVIINTCAVTERSEKKCRNYIRQGSRFSSSGKVIVTGCIINRDPSGILSMKEVGAVYSNEEKDRLVADLLKSPISKGLLAVPAGRTRAYVKIQDGCDGKCSYCIVPTVRGLPKSRSFNEIIEHSRHLIENGVPEIVLTGITIGKYDDDGNDISSVVESITQLPGKFRVRITSIEPLHLTDRVIALFSNEKVCPHIHLPIQSGSDKILSMMNRPYTRKQFVDKVHALKKNFPDIAIGTDIIVGFPGETEEDFYESVRIVEEAEFSYVHQFTFSKRSGTTAEAIPETTPSSMINDRCYQLRNVSMKSYNDYRKKFVGKTLLSVIEKKKGTVSALTGNYIKAELSLSSVPRDIRGIVPVKITSAGTVCHGEIVPI